MSGANKIIGGTFEDIKEEVNKDVVEPVKDEVGQAIEAGVQAVMGAKPPTPQQKPAAPAQRGEQQKKLEEQNKLTDARRKISWWQDLSARQKQVREEGKQKNLQKQQEEDQKKKEKKQVKQFEIVQKEQQLHPEIAAKGKAEIKRGVGG